jgi:cbb3-type cytochrome oxidase maturation protein
VDAFLLLTIAAIALGALGVALFFWTLKSGQYDDLDGAAERILIDDEEDSVR